MYVTYLGYFLISTKYNSDYVFILITHLLLVILLVIIGIKASSHL